MFTTDRLPPLIKDWQFWAGVIIAGGVTVFTPAIDYGLLALHLHRRFRLNIPVLLLGLLILPSVFMSTDWLEPVMWGFRALLLASLVRHVRITPHFAIGMTLVLLIQIPFIHHQLTNVQKLPDGRGYNVVRPWGMTPNGSILGMMGLTMLQTHPLTGIVAAVIVGLSQSRTYLLTVAVLGIFAIFKKDVLFVMVALMAGLVALVTAIETKSSERYTFWIPGSDTQQAMEKRNSLNNPDNMQPSENIQSDSIGTIDTEKSDTPEVVVDSKPLLPSLWNHLKSRPLGFGYGDYFHETLRPIPHNQFILALWELGWLAIPFLLTSLYLLWKGPLSWQHALAILPALFLTTEFFHRPHGVYGLTILIIGARHYVDVWKHRE